MSIPAALAMYLVSLHGFITANQIFNSTRDHMVNSRHSIGTWRTFKENERLISFPVTNTLFKSIFFLPVSQHLVTYFRQIQLPVFTVFLLHLLVLHSK